jgi:hypothetical protein
MFWSRFTYDSKGPCHIYFSETEDQKIDYMQTVQKLNEEENKEECRISFDRQEREKERIWIENRKRWPTRRASSEVYWKNNQIKRSEKSRGGVDNM